MTTRSVSFSLMVASFLKQILMEEASGGTELHLLRQRCQVLAVIYCLDRLAWRALGRGGRGTV
jgi:hypothetical protein